jgi:hypothetical protein
MLKELKFVRGSIAVKDMVPALRHLKIKDGRITGYNGLLSLSTPIDVDFDAVPTAATFIKAVNTCKEETEITRTKTGKLRLKSGNFKAFIECLDDWDAGISDPDTDAMLPLNAPLLPVVKKLQPFISVDASRPWSRGILLRDKCAYATNNICLLQQYTGLDLPYELVVPAATVKELIRIGEEPVGIGYNEKTLTFYYTDGRWMQSGVLDTDWPDINAALDAYCTGGGGAFPDNFFSTLAKLVPFLDDSRSVYFSENGSMGTSPHEETGALFDSVVEKDMRFNADQLLLLEQVASEMSFGNYPDPCGFTGERLRGVIIGMVL